MNRSIRTRTRYAIVGGDYSQQEPRLLAHLSNEESLKQNYAEGKDLYATIGSFIFHKDYWECMEHWEDGSPNPVGKDRRKKCKAIVLGISYGMGPKLLSSMLNVSIDECKAILDEFYKMFPAILEFTKQNEIDAREKGFVEDYIGRRRHLPDAGLPEMSFKQRNTVITNADVFMDCDIHSCQIDVYDDSINNQWLKKWEDYSKNSRKRQSETKADFKELAKSQNIEVRDNGAFISKTMTQCTNARIQGSAATLTKKAMVSIYNNEEMNKLGFKLLVPVHDELLGECPIKNAELIEQKLAESMIEAAKPECSVNMKVDTYVVNHWYADDISDQIKDTYDKLLKDMSEEEAYSIIQEKYSHFTEETLREMCNGTFDTLKENV